jgi:hypothetical protein
MEKNMSAIVSRLRGRTAAGFFAALVAAGALLGPAGCSRAKAKPELRCSLLEIRTNTASGYYDAVVRVERVTIRDPLKDQFQVMTPTSAFNLSLLKFTVEGHDPARIEPGETFIVPLKRPDWKFSVMAGDTEYFSENFWDRLPPKDQWHPTKTEAMAVAMTIEVVNERGLLKPVLASLPPEWRLAEETEPTADNPVGSSIYRKIRGGRTVEQVEVQYAQLTADQRAQLASTSPADFLAGWSECAKNGGTSADIAGHAAVACDLEGVGEFGWTYRYFYLTSDLVVAVDVQSDPEELGKTDQEKDEERRTDEIFFRYGYGPLGSERWQVMIEVRMNRTGAFHKRSRTGEAVNKDFKLSDAEYAAIEKALAENHFLELGSRSSLGPGFESFIAVRNSGGAHAVTMRDTREPLFEKIAAAIRGIVLPKVEENGMQPPAR